VQGVGAAVVGIADDISWQRHRCLYLEGADVDGAIDNAKIAALVGGRGVGIVAGVDGRAAGQQGHGRGGSAVVLQGAEQRVDVEQVAAGEAAAPGATADEVAALVGQRPSEVGAGRGAVAGEDDVVDGQHPGVVVDAAASVAAGVVAQSAVGDRQCPTVV